MFPGRCFAKVGVSRRDKGTADHLEVFTKISRLFFEDWIGSAIPALISRPRIVTDTVPADLQVIPAAVTGIAAAWLSAQGPFPAAFPTVACHGKEFSIQQMADNPQICAFRRLDSAKFTPRRVR